MKNVKEDDDGWYECFGDNSVGRNKSQVQLKVVCKLLVYGIQGGHFLTAPLQTLIFPKVFNEIC